MLKDFCKIFLILFFAAAAAALLFKQSIDKHIVTDRRALWRFLLFRLRLLWGNLFFIRIIRSRKFVSFSRNCDSHALFPCMRSKKVITVINSVRINCWTFCFCLFSAIGFYAIGFSAFFSSPIFKIIC